MSSKIWNDAWESFFQYMVEEFARAVRDKNQMETNGEGRKLTLAVDVIISHLKPASSQKILDNRNL